MLKLHFFRLAVAICLIFQLASFSAILNFMESAGELTAILNYCLCLLRLDSACSLINLARRPYGFMTVFVYSIC